MKHIQKHILFLLLCVLPIVFCTVPVFAADSTASTMQLTRTEGTVEAATSTGKKMSAIRNMRLYNGYQLSTKARSYAWISLDNTKLIKLDAVSKAGIRKRGTKLEVLLNSGNVFFDVAKPLQKNESLNIRTSTMVVGIRGTCGWVEIFNEKKVLLTILEGETQVTVQDPVSGQRATETVIGGETAVCEVDLSVQTPGTETPTEERCSISKNSNVMEEVKGFVLTEVVQSETLAERIFEKSEGAVDLREVTVEQAEQRLETEQVRTEEKLKQVETNQKAMANTVATVPVWSDSLPSTPPSTGSAAPSNPNPAPSPTPKRYTVTFNSNGGPAIPSAVVTEGQTVTKPDAADGYIFDGWYKDSDCTKPWDFAIETVTRDTTLYTRWMHWTVSGTTLTISGDGEMPDYARGSDTLWGSLRGTIRRVTIGENITKIGAYAFEGSKNLQTVYAPGVTEIGRYAFANCTGLVTLASRHEESVVLGNYTVHVPALTTIRAYAFDGCSNLGIIAIAESVATIEDNVFQGCAGGTGNSLLLIPIVADPQNYDSRARELLEDIPGAKIYE